MKEKCNNKENIVLESEKLINGVLKEKNLSYMKDELYDICMIGFTKGLNTFDNTKGTKLKTYVVACVKKEIAKYFYVNSMKKRDGITLSYNVVVDEEGTEIIDLIADDYNLEQNILLRENNRQLYSALLTLPKKNRDIICYSYGVFGYKKMTNTELAKKYNVLKTTIEKIKIDGKKKLKMILKNEYFSKYISDNYDNFLKSQNKEIVKKIIILEKKLDFRQKEYLLKSLKRNWEE